MGSREGTELERVLHKIRRLSIFKEQPEGCVTMGDNKAQAGTWILISPNGREFRESSPLKCCAKERRTRVSDGVVVRRILSALDQCDLCGESGAKYVLGRGTPAEITVCLTCKNTILNNDVVSTL